MLLPKLYRIRQKLNPPVVPDVAAAVKAAIEKLDLQGRVKPGGRVAVTGGSRGVANIGTILKATCGCLKELGAQPFIVPAMGSHGGATTEGQAAHRLSRAHRERTDEDVGDRPGEARGSAARPPSRRGRWMRSGRKSAGEAWTRM